MVRRDYRMFRPGDLLELHDALVGTMRRLHPGMDAHAMCDYLMTVAAILGADLARHEENPEAMAEQMGFAMTENVKKFVRDDKANRQ